MPKNRGQMVTIVADALGKSESASAISATVLGDRVVDFLNWGQQRVARFHNFHELNILHTGASTVTTIKTYPFVSGSNNLGLTRPKDIASIRLIDSENSRILRRRSPRWFDQQIPRPENYVAQRPEMYIRWGNEIELFRIPDTAYNLSIRYPQWAPDLTSASQTSVFERKDQLLITVGVLEGYLHFQEYEDAKIWYQRFLGQLTDAVHAEGDVDWEPQASEFMPSPGGYRSGEPWLDPYAGVGDALYNYPE